MKRYLPYALLVAVSLQIATPALAEWPDRRFDYSAQPSSGWGRWFGQSFDSWFNENLIDAVGVGFSAGPEQILPHLIDKNATSFVYRLIIRLLGINNSNHSNLVSWFLGQGKSGLSFYHHLGGKVKNWLPLFLIKIVGPAFVKRAITGLIYKSISNGFGLDFPDWIKQWSFLHAFLAMNIQSFAHMGLDVAYHKGLDVGQHYL